MYSSLPRAQLQRMAKERGIKANQKTSDLIGDLEALAACGALDLDSDDDFVPLADRIANKNKPTAAAGGRSGGRGTREALAPLTPNTPVRVGGTAGDKGKGRARGTAPAVTTAADEDEDGEDDEEMQMWNSGGGGGSSSGSPDALLVMSPAGSSANAIEIFEDDTVDDEALARRLQKAGSDSEGENEWEAGAGASSSGSRGGGSSSSSSSSSSRRAAAAFGASVRPPPPPALGDVRRSYAAPAGRSSSQQREIEAAYLADRRADLRRRAFKIASQIPVRETIPTGRTIKKMRGWGAGSEGAFWPAIREFMQNTVDHLCLIDPMTGRRHAALRMRVAHDSGASETKVEFCCGDEVVCTIVAARDELRIEQQHTFPLALRALDTGVPDTAKQGADSAGGFGDGFKTAAVALAALGSDFRGLTWEMEAEGHHIEWDFVGVERHAVGTFAKCKVLVVEVSRQDGVAGARQNVMVQRARVRGIGDAFVKQAMPRLQVFWNVDEAAVISMRAGGGGSGRGRRKGGGDFICDAAALPPLPGLASVHGAKPAAGVFVRGIWVRAPKITGTVMSFFGDRLDVSGRDRNEVNDDDLVAAVMQVLYNCGDRPYLAALLAPLRGKAAAAASKSSSSSSSSSPKSWFMRTPAFLNRCLDTDRDFFVHDVFGFPKSAIFVSSRTMASKDPFIAWAAGFLQAKGAPLTPLEQGASKRLFEEVSKEELTARCVKLLSVEKHSAGLTALKRSVEKVMAFMAIRITMVFSSSVSIAFVSKTKVFVPAARLTRGLLVKIMSLVMSEFNAADPAVQMQGFTSLMQALCEGVAADRTLSEAEVTSAIKRAKEIKAEADNFATRPVQGMPPPPTAAKNDGGAPVDLTEDDAAGGKGGGGGSKRDRVKHSFTSAADEERDLREQINKAKRQKQGGGGGSSDVVPASTMGLDDPERQEKEECCTHSELVRVQAGAAVGGGEMLCDRASAAMLAGDDVKTQRHERIRKLRQVLQEALDVVRAAEPALGALLNTVEPGFDDGDYYAFADPAAQLIVVNLKAFLPKLPSSNNKQRDSALLYEFVETVTHEVAHLLEVGGGHGVAWRARHMQLLRKVYAGAHCSGGGSGCKCGRGAFGAATKPKPNQFMASLSRSDAHSGWR